MRGVQTESGSGQVGRAPPDVDGLVLELDATYSASSIDSSDQVDRSQELTCVDIDTFLASF